MIFNKLSKYQKNYDYLTGIFKSSGLDTEDKLKAYLSRITRRAIIFSTVVCVAAMALYWYAPEYLAIWGMLAILVLAWGMSSALTANKIINQYIREEINQSE